MTGAVDSQMKGFASHLSLGCDSPEPRQEVKWSLDTHHRDLPLSSLTLHQGLITLQIPKPFVDEDHIGGPWGKEKDKRVVCVLRSGACMCMCKDVLCMHVCVYVMCVRHVCVVGTSQPHHRAHRKSYQEAVLMGSTN